MESDIGLKEPKPGSTKGMSAHMAERFIRMVGTLRLAQGAVDQELEPLQEAGGPDSADGALWHLYVRVCDLSTQADVLLLEMNERGAPTGLITAAESLSDHFWATRKRIATML
jgi:hypothetical protein